MRKEVIFAILAGISIGLVAAFGTWRVSKLVKPTPQSTTKTAKTTPQKKIDTVTIDNLKDYDVVTEIPTIKGLAAPNTDIIVSTQESDYYTKSDSDGEFEIKIEIPTGISEVKINDQKVILVYSSEVESGSVSYAGTITDISSNTIQIKNKEGLILQISTPEETKYINTLKKNVEVKHTDLAIGDYIVAMGKISANKVLTTQRILITSPLMENNYQVEKIEIEKLSKTNINNVTLPKKWNGPDIKELEVGKEIYIIGNTNEGRYSLRSIFIPVE
jgi:hypothetical protein